MTRHLCTFVLFVIVAASCNGKTGPTGPAGTTGATGAVGTTGATGPAGPGTHFVASAVVPDAGSVSINLPAAAGSIGNPPVMTCYVSSGSPAAPSGYFIIAGRIQAGEPSCSIGLSGSVLSVNFVGVPGRLALVSVVY